MAAPRPHDRTTRLYEGIVSTLWPIFLHTWHEDWRGGEHIPRSGGFVLASNHLSYADPFPLAQFLVANERRPRFLAKQGLFTTPGVKTVMTNTGQIPVLRGSTRAVDAYEAAVEAIHRGDCVAVLPEGTLTRDPDLWPMTGKTGAARIALATGCPLVPMAIWGTQDLLYPYRGKVPRVLPRKTIKVYAGPPVPLDDLVGQPLTTELLRIATTRLMDAITVLMEAERGSSAPAGRYDPRLRARRKDG